MQNKMDSEIIGAIIGVGGVIIGIIIDRLINFFQNIRKLEISGLTWDEKLLSSDTYGGDKESDDPNNAFHCKLNCAFDVYNCSNTTKIMHDINLVLKDYRNTVLNPNSTIKVNEVSDGKNNTSDLLIVNVMPKMMKRIEVIGFESDKETMFNIHCKTDRVYLCYKNEKNKSKKVLVYRKANNDLTEDKNGQAENAEQG